MKLTGAIFFLVASIVWYMGAITKSGTDHNIDQGLAMLFVGLAWILISMWMDEKKR